MRSKKSILFVMNTLGRAGAERALIELMRALDPEKYRIFLYVLIPRGELFAEVPEYVKVLNRKTAEQPDRDRPERHRENGDSSGQGRADGENPAAYARRRDARPSRQL